MAFAPLFGYAPNPDGTQRFLRTLPRPLLSQAGPDLTLDTSRDVFLGTALLSCSPNWRRGAQEVGSCVGWGWALAVDVLASCDVHLRHEAEVWGGDTLAASIYGFSRVEVRGQRNLGGDGSYGAAAAKAVTQYGTLHVGQDYGGKKFLDQNGKREREWGRDGVPDELEAYAARHKVSDVALIKTFEDCAKALQSGYPSAVTGMLGFSMTLTDGYMRPGRQPWPHCQMAAGVRWKPDPAILVVNSWADCYDGTVDKNLPPAFQRSAGWVRAEDFNRLIEGLDSFALSGYSGFSPREIPENWLRGIM